MKVWVLYNFEDYGDFSYIRLYTTRELAMAALMADIDSDWAQHPTDEIERAKREAREFMDSGSEWWPSRKAGYAITEEVVHDQKEGGVK